MAGLVIVGVAAVAGGFAGYLGWTHTSNSENTDSGFDQYVVKPNGGGTSWNTDAVICAKTYEHIGKRGLMDVVYAYKGGVFIKNWFGPTANDKMSSVEVYDGCELTLYEHWYEGTPSTTIKYTPLADGYKKDLTDIGWNDKVSSYSCTCQDWRYEKPGRRLEKLESASEIGSQAINEDTIVMEPHAIHDPRLPPMDAAGVPFTEDEVQLSRTSSEAEHSADVESLEGIVVVAESVEELKQFFATASSVGDGRVLHIWRTYRPLIEGENEDPGLVAPSNEDPVDEP